MYSLNDNDDLGFVDVLFNTLAMMVAALVILILWVNPAEKQDETAPGDGNLVVELSWPAGLSADVDLYVLAPGDTVPTHFNRKHGPVLDLKRDDLGTTNDFLDINYEKIESRGTPDGEYVIAVHLYNYTDASLPLSANPVIARVKVSHRADMHSSYKTLHEATATLTHIKDEAFIIRLIFRDEKFVEKSDLPMVLANQWNSSNLP